MRFLLVCLVILIPLAVVGGLFFWQKVGNPIPAFAPATQNVSDLIEKGQVEDLRTGQTDNSPLKLPSGFKISVFAKNLPGVRSLTFTPGGVLLASIPSQGRVVALLDRNNNDISEETKDVLVGLGLPHGITFYQGKLYVAEEDKVGRYNFFESTLTAIYEVPIGYLPKGGEHKTRSIVFDGTGQMFVSVGSSCNVCNETKPENATILTAAHPGNQLSVYATGLRNPVFMAVNPETNELWATEMGRDFLGDDLPPDEIDVIKQGGHYGWPFCYGHQVHDDKFDPQNSFDCAKTVPPAYELCAHCAPLGLTFINSSAWPTSWQGDLLVALHGSWNRSEPSGYKVVHLKFQDGQIVGEEDFITGFLQGGQALGRPVDLLIGPNGKLYISDDKAGVVYVVSRRG